MQREFDLSFPSHIIQQSRDLHQFIQTRMLFIVDQEPRFLYIFMCMFFRYKQYYQFLRNIYTVKAYLPFEMKADHVIHTARDFNTGCVTS